MFLVSPLNEMNMIPNNDISGQLKDKALVNTVNPIPTGGALLGPNDLKQSGISTVLWLESPKFMTLFISVSVWSQ